VQVTLSTVLHPRSAVFGFKAHHTDFNGGWYADRYTIADGQVCKSKLNMVDLAGSERSAKTGTEGAVAREGLYINKSLSFLEQVQYL
jgi:hypothetical protein